MVIIGVDPHKHCHTAVAIDEHEREVARIEVRATAKQLAQLQRWAARFDDRLWAVESASGLGYLLSQQLVDAGERVLDVPPTLASRVRVLSSGRSDKNDPNDGLSVAIAALRAPGLASVRPADHAEVLRLLARRNLELGRERSRAACRLHALLAELVAGGVGRDIKASTAEKLLFSLTPGSAVEATRIDMALELCVDIRRLDDALSALKRRITDAVAASRTSLTDIFGVGPVVACLVIGYVGDVARFVDRNRFAAYNGTAPREQSSGGRIVHRLSRRGNRRLNYAIHVVAVAQIRHAHSPGRTYYDRKIAEGKTPREAMRALKRRISDVIYRQLLIDAGRGLS